jgi:hypothetical protein
MTEIAAGAVETDPAAYLRQAWQETVDVVIAATTEAISGGLGVKGFRDDFAFWADDIVVALAPGHDDRTRRTVLKIRFDTVFWEGWKASCVEAATPDLRQFYEEQVFNALDIFKDHYLRQFLQSGAGSTENLVEWSDEIVGEIAAVLESAVDDGRGRDDSVRLVRDHLSRISRVVRDDSPFRLISFVDHRHDLLIAVQASITSRPELLRVYQCQVMPRLEAIWTAMEGVRPPMPDVLPFTTGWWAVPISPAGESPFERWLQESLGRIQQKVYVWIDPKDHDLVLQPLAALTAALIPRLADRSFRDFQYDAKKAGRTFFECVKETIASAPSVREFYETVVAPTVNAGLGAIKDSRSLENLLYQRPAVEARIHGAWWLDTHYERSLPRVPDAPPPPS